MADDGSASGSNAVVEIIPAPQALDRFVLFSYLPTELRWMIYDMMLRITRGPQSFLYFPNGYTFVTGLDFGFPLLATVCHDMYHYVVHHSGFQRVYLDYMVLRAPAHLLLPTSLMPPHTQSHSLPLFCIICVMWRGPYRGDRTNSIGNI
ncbi:uncharacterized protein PG986_010048 [Apiospora aurea]|uniref:Uncharacterized protein n=1 Tax=Apiospora aurea TaxID=335848 RepID=A0ABR1Q9E9_9PEZI